MSGARAQVAPGMSARTVSWGWGGPLPPEILAPASQTPAPVFWVFVNKNLLSSAQLCP